MKFEYDVIYNEFVSRMNALLARAKKGDATALNDYQVIKNDFDARAAEGFIDWESDISRHLKMLEYWCKRAAAAPQIKETI